MVKQANFELEQDIINEISNMPNVIAKNMQKYELTPEQLNVRDLEKAFRLYGNGKKEQVKTQSIKEQEKTSFAQYMLSMQDQAIEIPKVESVDLITKDFKNVAIKNFCKKTFKTLYRATFLGLIFALGRLFFFF